jgi:hypothetical protein
MKLDLTHRLSNLTFKKRKDSLKLLRAVQEQKNKMKKILLTLSEMQIMKIKAMQGYKLYLNHK